MNRVLNYLESIYQIARLSCEEYSPELLSRIDKYYNEVKNILEKGDKFKLEDYTFNEMVNLFKELLIDYEIKEQNLANDYKIIIEYKDYEGWTTQLFYDESGKFSSRWRG